MNIQFKAANYELTQDEESLFEAKLGTLSKYSGTGEKEFQLHVTLGKNTEAHQNGGIWFADAEARLNGKTHFAHATRESLRDAVDGVLSELSRELSQAKDKRKSLMRRSGARLKRLFTSGS